jgi:hypothetical protein
MVYALIAGSCSIVWRQHHNEVFRKHGASPKHCRENAGPLLLKKPLQQNTMDMHMHILAAVESDSAQKALDVPTGPHPTSAKYE